MAIREVIKVTEFCVPLTEMSYLAERGLEREIEKTEGVKASCKVERDRISCRMEGDASKIDSAYERIAHHYDITYKKSSGIGG